MIKLIACDIDGTSVRDDRTMSQRVKDAIISATKKGVTFAFSTGRMYTSAKKFSDNLDIDHPIIACNGALIRMSKSKEILSYHPMDKEFYDVAVQLMWDYGVPFQAYYNEKVVAPKYSPYSSWYSQSFGVDFEITEDINVIKNKQAIKLMAFEPSERLITVRDAIRKECGDGLNLTISGDNLLDITKGGISKGHAIKKLAELLNIDISYVMAIGDAANDIEMLETVGFPVAVGNAIEEVKNIAKVIVATNEEDGVAEAIEKYVI